MMHHVPRAILCALVAVCVGLAAVQDASAQGANFQRPSTGNRGVGEGDWVFVPTLKSVFQKPRPDYDPLGLRSGNWLFYPEVTTGVAFDDNVFAEESDRTSDFIFTATPAFRLESDWNVHMLGVEGAVTGEKYADETDEDNIEARGTVFGRLDITGDDTLFGSASYRRETVSRDDPEENGGDLTDVNRYIGRMGYIHQFARLNVRFDVVPQRYDYLASDDNDRDRNQLDVSTNISYALSPRITPFVAVGFQGRNYDSSVDDNGFDRDSQQFAAAVGARILITDLLVGELAVGVEHTEFDDDRFEALTTPQVLGSLTWNPTELTSVILRARRTEDPTTQAGSATKVVTAATIRVEHELLRNLLLYGEAGYHNDEFEDIDRTDHRFLAGLGGEFLLDRNFSFFAAYSFEDRLSDGGDDEFTRNLVLIGVRAQY
jgi:hypothetical protein